MPDQNTEWRHALEDFLRKNRVSSTADATKYGTKTLGVSERSVKSHISDLIKEGELITVTRGLYAAYDHSDPVKPQEVVKHINKKAVVGLDSVFNENGGKSKRAEINGNKGAVYALLPIENISAPPRVGEVQTGVGKIRLYSISESLLNSGDKKMSRPSDNGRWTESTPEAAVAMAIYLSDSGRSKYHIEQIKENIQFPKVDASAFFDIAKTFGIQPNQIANKLQHFQQED